MHQVDLPEVLRMLSASGTNVVPVNTHRLGSNHSREDLLIGFGDVTFDRLADQIDLSGYALMANINHQTTAVDCIEKTRIASALLGTELIKIEVLQSDLRRSNDADLIEAVATLSQADRGLLLMPLLSNDVAVAKELVELGCPVLRVMGGPIGSGSGIADPDSFARICELGVPVMLDGGVGRVEDHFLALRLGAKGSLVNSMLFATPDPPHRVLGHFVRAVEDAEAREDRLT